MTKIDTSPIEEMHAHLVQENQRLEAELAMLREVNAAQAEQIRKAQERVRYLMARSGK